jgi:hypothetical protein
MLTFEGSESMGVDDIIVKLRVSLHCPPSINATQPPSLGFAFPEDRTSDCNSRCSTFSWWAFGYDHWRVEGLPLDTL